MRELRAAGSHPAAVLTLAVLLAGLGVVGLGALGLSATAASDRTGGGPTDVRPTGQVELAPATKYVMDDDGSVRRVR